MKVIVYKNDSGQIVRVYEDVTAVMLDRKNYIQDSGLSILTHGVLTVDDSVTTQAGKYYVDVSGQVVRPSGWVAPSGDPDPLPSGVFAL